MSATIELMRLRAATEAAGFALREILDVLNDPNRQAFKERDLRDEFAMAALTGMLARPNSRPAGYSKDAEGYSAAAYEHADAMLEARK